MCLIDSNEIRRCRSGVLPKSIGKIASASLAAPAKGLLAAWTVTSDKGILSYCGMKEENPVVVCARVKPLEFNKASALTNMQAAALPKFFADNVYAQQRANINVATASVESVLNGGRSSVSAMSSGSCYMYEETEEVCEDDPTGWYTDYGYGAFGQYATISLLDPWCIAKCNAALEPAAGMCRRFPGITAAQLQACLRGVAMAQAECINDCYITLTF